VLGVVLGVVLGLVDQAGNPRQAWCPAIN